MNGPALKGSRERWIENSTELNFYAFIKYSQVVIATGDSYAINLFNKWKVLMLPVDLTKEEIDEIFIDIESYVPPVVEHP